jgi:hypothetical protein
MKQSSKCIILGWSYIVSELPCLNIVGVLVRTRLSTGALAATTRFTAGSAGYVVLYLKCQFCSPSSTWLFSKTTYYFVKLIYIFAILNLQVINWLQSSVVLLSWSILSKYLTLRLPRPLPTAAYFINTAMHLLCWKPWYRCMYHRIPWYHRIPVLFISYIKFEGNML